MYSLKDLETMPMTNLRIFVSLHLAVVYMLFVFVGIVMGKITSTNESSVQNLGIILSIWLGIDVAHFSAKRFSDRGLAEAKASGPAQVNVESPSTVKVDAAPVHALAGVRTPEKGEDDR